MNKISVVLADDHVLMRKGLRKILELEEDIEVIGEASNGFEAIDEVLEKQPDVLLLDINMPGMNGVEVTKELSDKNLKTKIIILTIYDDREYFFELIKMGVLGYVLKDIEPQGLIDAVRHASCGEAYIQPSLTKALVNEYNKMHQPVISSIENLTPREKEVAKRIADGMNNYEIACKLNISEKTVKNHVSSILKKLKLMDRTQVAVFILKNNLV